MERMDYWHGNKTSISKMLGVVLLALTVFACSNKKDQSKQVGSTTNTEKDTATTYNTLSQQEKEAGWTLLFDGKSTEKWRGSSQDSFPEAGWVIRDGTLT